MEVTANSKLYKLSMVVEKVLLLLMNTITDFTHLREKLSEDWSVFLHKQY